MRRALLLFGIVASSLAGGAQTALAGGQEDPGPGGTDVPVVVTAPPETDPATTEDPGSETPLPGQDPTAEPSTTTPVGVTSPTLPEGCEAPPPPKTVFIGRLTAAAGGVGRFTVQAVRADPDGIVQIGLPVDVELGDDVRFLTLEQEYLVAAEVAAGGGLRSTVHQDQPLFGGDQVVGINDGDVKCPNLISPIVVRKADGGSIDTGVFGGFLDDKRGIGLAFLKPAAAVAGVLVGLVSVKYVLIGIGKGVAFIVRSIRRRSRLRRGGEPAGATG